ncbi:hypothetical protein GCM10010404_90170 [Nonomuraea africana]|uniref:Uncharacterized protein n=1 Tax=Nonomuraea africana TaxID=46171 RepID=A0ABR9KF17_9ACTN|nr:hypothetical protein [Nonomuraea africana]MBE1560127.1 hypothetical protein [Nonomuraea africana]
MSEHESDPEVVAECVSFVRMWAEAVLRQVERVHTMREKLHRDDRNYERMEDWSPTEEDLQENFRSLWTEEHTLIWSAHQLERWSRRLARERRQEPPEHDRVLADVRNALEHLDDADFDDGHAVAVTGGRTWSLRALPGSRLQIAAGGDLSFGLINGAELQSRALAVVRRIEDELEEAAVARYQSWLADVEKEDRALRRFHGGSVG